MKVADMNDNYVIDAEDGLAELDGPKPAAKLFPTKSRKRKPKVSKVATDYDPFDTVTAMPDGYQRPAQKCWADKSVARPVSLLKLSPLWRQDIDTMGTNESLSKDHDVWNSRERREVVKSSIRSQYCLGWANKSHKQPLYGQARCDLQSHCIRRCMIMNNHWPSGLQNNWQKPTFTSHQTIMSVSHRSYPEAM